MEEENELVILSEVTQLQYDFITNLKILGFDYEANSLDPYIASPLLMVLGNDIDQLVIDCTSINCIEVLSQLDENQAIIGANLKYDYKIAKVKHKHIFARMFDVMIAEQRLLQGITEFSQKRNKMVPISCSLEAITQRRLNILPDGMDKAVRQEFIGANPDTFIFKNKHIKYAAADIKPLYQIREIQKEAIEKRGLQLLIYGIEFPCIRELGDAELEGFIIDEVKWKDNIAFNKEQKFIYQCKLDEELRRLRDTTLQREEAKYLKGGVWDRDRRKATEVIQDNLFGDMFDEIAIVIPTKKKSKAKLVEPYINYASTTQLVYIFGKLKQPLPTKEGVYAVPTFNTKLNGKEIVDKSTYSFTTGEKEMDSYLSENSNVNIRTFVEYLIKYREYTTRLNTFGQNFLTNFKNPITKKYHTVFRQCDAITGRLQSGESKNGWFNSQNIPAEKRYREAFGVEEDYEVCTTDLSGAEAVIMIDKARDEKFYEMAILKDDAHSPLATAVWRAIGKHRINAEQETWGEVKQADIDLARIVISKKDNKDMRTAFKPMTFGSIYGMYPKKTAKTLNITVEEAKVALKSMKSMIPKTFAMVERNAEFALANGYLILNHRTNSRIWYKPVLDARANKSDLPFKESSDIAGSARNCPIQGTQADMVKEMMVEIGKEIRRQNMDAALLIQVHDELVYKSRIGMELVEFIRDKDKVVELVTFGEFVKKMMCQVANRYLSFIQMTAEQHTGKTWTK